MDQVRRRLPGLRLGLPGRRCRGELSDRGVVKVDAAVGISTLLFPAAAVGVPAMLVGLLGMSMSTVANAAVFGFAAGMFLHVATDFLPRCEVSEVAHDGSKDARTLLNRLRLHAVASTALGGIFIFAAWAVLAM